MAQKIVGLDLGTHSVKAVLISSGLRGAQVLETCEQVLEDPPKNLTAALHAAVEVGIGLLRQKGWHEHALGLVLPGQVGSYRVLNFPFGDARRIAQVVAFEADGQFAVPLEQLEYDHIVVSSSRSSGKALVVAIKRELVEELSAVFKAAEIDLKLMTLAPIAVAQALAGAPVPELPSTEEDAPGQPAAALVIDMGHRLTQMLAMGSKGPLTARVVRRGSYQITRAVAKALGCDTQTAEAAKLRDATAPHAGLDARAQGLPMTAAVGSALEPLLREIEHTRMWLRTEHGREVSVVRLLGGGSQLNGLDVYLQEHLELPVERAAPSEGKGLRKLGARDWTTACAALGGAMGAARRPLIQLYADTTVEGEGGGWVIERLPAVAAIGLAILAAGSLDTIARLGALEAEEQAYRNELATLSQKLFDEEVTSEEDIKARLDTGSGQDLTKLITERGAVEVLAVIAKASRPAGPKPAAAGDGSLVMPGAPVASDGTMAGPRDPAGRLVNPDGSPMTATDPATGAPLSPTVAEGEEAAAAPADADAGITWEDELHVQYIEIRENKIKLKAAANWTSAKERLKRKLSAITCINDVLDGGRVLDQNDRKVFEIEIDHDCYVRPLEVET